MHQADVTDPHTATVERQRDRRVMADDQTLGTAHYEIVRHESLLGSLVIGTIP